jgi:hypothetical protein
MSSVAAGPSQQFQYNGAPLGITTVEQVNQLIF